MKENGFSPIHIIFFIGSVLFIAFGIYYGSLILRFNRNVELSNTKDQELSASASATKVTTSAPLSTSIPTPSPQTDTFLGIKYVISSDWEVTKIETGMNPELAFKSKKTTANIYVYKNFVGGIAGVSELKKSEITINGKTIPMVYYTEDSEIPEQVTLYITYEVGSDKYFIASQWKISDNLAENEAISKINSLQFPE